jgi:hypothetical protein
LHGQAVHRTQAPAGTSGERREPAGMRRDLIEALVLVLVLTVLVGGGLLLQRVCGDLD